MGYVKLSENKYKITIELGYDTLGKRRRKTEIFTGTLQEVKIRDAELIKKHYCKSNVASVKELSFEQYSEIFLNKYCKDNLSLVTTDGYEKSLKRILPIIGKFKLDKITPYILDSMYQKLKTGITKKQLGYSSMYEFYKLINVMFNQAVKWELIDRNPNLKATKPKKQKIERRYYDLEQVNMLVSCLVNENIKYRALIILALDSGARRGEICALRWSDIDFNKNTLKIDNSLKVVKGVLDEKDVKTPASNREIIISNATISILKEYKEWQDSYKKWMGNKWKGTDRVFIAKDGRYMFPDTCSQILYKVIKRNKLPKLSFHELRHTSASVLIHKGINPKAVSQRLGHSSTDVTMEIYTHVHDITKTESAIAFDEIINI